MNARKIACGASVATVVGCLLVLGVFRWTHIDMTETRMLAEMWEWYGVMTLSIVGILVTMPSPR